MYEPPLPRQTINALSVHTRQHLPRNPTIKFYLFLPPQTRPPRVGAYGAQMWWPCDASRPQADGGEPVRQQTGLQHQLRSIIWLEKPRGQKRGSAERVRPARSSDRRVFGFHLRAKSIPACGEQLPRGTSMSSHMLSLRPRPFTQPLLITPARLMLLFCLSSDLHLRRCWEALTLSRSCPSQVR